MVDINYIIPGGGIIQDTEVGFEIIIPGVGIYIERTSVGTTTTTTSSSTTTTTEYLPTDPIYIFKRQATGSPFKREEVDIVFKRNSVQVVFKVVDRDK